MRPWCSTRPKYCSQPSTRPTFQNLKKKLIDYSDRTLSTFHREPSSRSRERKSTPSSRRLDPRKPQNNCLKEWRWESKFPRKIIGRATWRPRLKSDPSSAGWPPTEPSTRGHLWSPWSSRAWRIKSKYSRRSRVRKTSKIRDPEATPPAQRT